MKQSRSSEIGALALLLVAAALATICALPAQAANGVPQPDHVVIVIEENHSYNEIIGSSAAPYINSLAAQGALFTQSFAIEHPSEPNYLDLFSGANQGVTDDSCPHSFATANLGAELIAKGFSFSGYSEDLPSVGYTGCTYNNYARKHNPWSDFNTGSNAVPAADNLPFAGSWPANNFSNLPTVSIVVPNLLDDMHDGSIQQGDSWLRGNLDSYVQWAMNNNSLLILTFDEDDSSQGNQIATIFVGPMVTPGQYSGPNGWITHYTVLRTVEDMYGLAYAGASATETPITDCWTSSGSVPPAPTNLSASASDSQVSLSWTGSSGASSYNIYRGPISGGEGTTPIATGVTSTNYTDTGLSNGTTYYFTVTAVNSSGESAPSNEASATPKAIPAAPSNLAAQAVSRSQINLTWTNNNTNATGISIERSRDNVSFTEIATLTPNATSYADTGLARRTIYYYRIRAVNGGVYSAYSNTASATTLKR